MTNLKNIADTPKYFQHEGANILEAINKTSCAQAYYNKQAENL